MPSYLDFESSRAGKGMIGPVRTGFRDFVLSKTLKVPNGPQSFTEKDYRYSNLSDFPNIDQGDVVKNEATNRDDQLKRNYGLNRFKADDYFVVEELRNIILNNGLKLYPYFPTSIPSYNLVGIMGSSTYDTESELFKFAADFIKNDTNGPVYQRIKQNTERLTNGRLRILDALNGNTNTAINLLSGRESLIELNNAITVGKTVPGKGIDFIENSLGIEIPVSQIPGDYLTNPYRPNKNSRPTPSTETGKLLQDVTGVLGSMVGIQRRPTETRKPSDLLIEYMGEGQKQRLFDALSFSKYAPNYTTTARSQNTSKIFNFVDNVAGKAKSILGTEAPAGVAYIGDDRGNDVKHAVNDLNDRPVRSSYYLSLMFDSVAAELFHQPSTIMYGGFAGGQLTWISKNSKNKLGTNNKEYTSQEQSKVENSLSTNFTFREDSLLGYTQELLNSLPSDAGAARSHVANVIDQTSRMFADGNIKISRGSAIKYTSKFTLDEAGMEFCRVWTKDRPYLNYSDTMKRTSNIRKFDSSVMGGESRPWNLNIAPMSDGRRDFTNSTNIVTDSTYGNIAYAKKYMFSIENLAWKTSNLDGFRVIDLPASERGPNGGRVMWFPPYDLKVSEQNSARWEENTFLGRPEPIYTYQNTARSGQVSFKVVVDHPSIMNLLVNDFFKDMTDEEADNYINAVFAGCEELDFYDLVRRFTNLEPNDLKLVQEYLNNKKSSDAETIKSLKYTAAPPTKDSPLNPNNVNFDGSGESINSSVKFFFKNDSPQLIKGYETTSQQTYETLYNTYKNSENESISSLKTDLLDILTGQYSGKTGENDRNVIFNKPYPLSELSGTGLTQQVEQIISIQTGSTANGYTQMNTGFGEYNSQITTLKENIKNGSVSEVVLTIISSSSEVADVKRNFFLGVRRAHSVYSDFLNKFQNGKTVNADSTWFKKEDLEKYVAEGMEMKEINFSFKQFGYENDGILKIRVQTSGENSVIQNPTNSQDNLNCNTKLTTNNGLKITAPVAFFCRQATVKLEYQKIGKKQNETIKEIELPKGSFEMVETTIPGKKPKPSINTMQRIIMKTLSESYYFKKLEETDPIVFSSLREKLRYFHPGFHSTTPEGLNSRLTFLLQCVRPGDTMPIKGVDNTVDIGARNTTFGPPPICIMRIGDFYHSKVVIRDVNITFDDNVWDLNPEGIGVQPMIANVSLQVNFIGGQGLDKPVERLQNALSSNFFGNTEMYDERATITSNINGQSSEDFTKSFLEDLQKNFNVERKPEKDSSKGTTITQGTYVGVENSDKIVYTNLIESENGILKKIENYHNSYKTTYNEILRKYGNKIASMFFSETYRTVKDLTINGGSVSSVELLGQYPINKDLSYLSRLLKVRVAGAITDNNITQMMGFDKTFPEKYSSLSEKVLKPYLKDLTGRVIDSFVENKSIKDLEKTRNELIYIVDSLNYITNYQHDGYITGTNYTSTDLMSFVVGDFYNEYKSGIEFLEKINSEFIGDLDNSINFFNPTIDNSTLKELLSIFLQNTPWSEFVSIYKDPVFTEEYKLKMREKFLDFKNINLKEKKFKERKYPIRKNNTPIEFTKSTNNEITDTTEQDVLKKINNSSNKLGKTLNFYKP